MAGDYTYSICLDDLLEAYGFAYIHGDMPTRRAWLRSIYSRGYTALCGSGRMFFYTRDGEEIAQVIFGYPQKAKEKGCPQRPFTVLIKENKNARWATVKKHGYGEINQ